MSHLSTQSSTAPRLSVVIPAYNEAARLAPTLRSIDAFAAAFPGGVEVLVVDDGSTDQTPDAVRQLDLAHARLRLLENEGNRGKGYSVRRGMLAASGDVVLMSDADLSTPIEEVEKLVAWIGEYSVVIGSRDMADSVLDPPQPVLRRLTARVFRGVRRAIMLRRIRDTQCGFKCFTREAARAVFERQQADGFAFDCEALGLAERLGYRIKEVGVVWRNDEDSRLNPWRDSLGMFASLLRIRRRLSRFQPDGAREVGAAVAARRR